MAEAEENRKPPRNIAKLLGIAFVTLNMVVVGFGAYLTYAGTIGYVPPQVSENELNRELLEFRSSLQNKPVIYTMDTFNTNLDGLPRRLIRLEVNVEMLDAEGFEEVIGLGGESRDSIMRIINAKKFQDLETVQGKLGLKNEIISSLNASLERGVVKNIYFSKFQIQ